MAHHNLDFLFAVEYHIGIANETLQPTVILGYIQRILKLALDTNLYKVKQPIPSCV